MMKKLIIAILLIISTFSIADKAFTQDTTGAYLYSRMFLGKPLAPYGGIYGKTGSFDALYLNNLLVSALLAAKQDTNYILTNIEAFLAEKLDSTGLAGLINDKQTKSDILTNIVSYLAGKQDTNTTLTNIDSLLALKQSKSTVLDNIVSWLASKQDTGYVVTLPDLDSLLALKQDKSTILDNIVSWLASKQDTVSTRIYVDTVKTDIVFARDVVMDSTLTVGKRTSLDSLITGNINFSSVTKGITWNGHKLLQINQSKDHIIFSSARNNSQNITGTNNYLFGYTAGSNITSGSWNILFGYATGSNLDTQQFNVGIGHYSLNLGSNSNVLAIGNYTGLRGNWTNKLFIDNINRSDSSSILTRSLIVGDFNADSSLQKLRFNAEVSSFNVLPITTRIYNLGSAALYWKTLYAQNIYIDTIKKSIVAIDTIYGGRFKNIDGGPVNDIDTTKLTWNGQKIGIKPLSITAAEIAPGTITANEIASSVLDSISVRVDTAYYRALIDSLLQDIDTSYISGRIDDVEDSIDIHRGNINVLTDTSTSHNTRLNSNRKLTVDSISAHNSRLNTNVDSVTSHNSRINVARDSLTSHNSRINTDRQLAIDSVSAHNTRINTNKQLAADSILSHNNRINVTRDSITAHNSRINITTDSISSHNSRINVTTKFAVDSIGSHNSRINTTTKYATDSIGAHNTRINVLKSEVDTKVTINDSLQIGNILLRDQGGALVVDDNTIIKGNLQADTLTVENIINNGLAYGSAYISDDYPDTIMVSDLAQYYTVGAKVGANGKQWTSGGVLKNVTVVDSMMIVGVAGKYEVSYSFSFQTISGAINAYYNFYIFINDVKQEKTGSKRLMSGSNDLGIGSIAPTVLDLNAGDIIELKLQSPSDKDNNVCFQYAIIHCKKIDN